MCLILFSLAHHPRFPLVIAANRDEAYRRPSSPAGYWSDAPHVLGGRDLEAGGTWLGITRDGRWAALTNFRQAGAYKADSPSRGQLAARFLTGTARAADFAREVQRDAHRYNGFNLLLGEPGVVYYVSNRSERTERLVDGVHGLSNHLLDTPWPKVSRGKQALAALSPQCPRAATQALLAALRDASAPEETELPDTGIGVAGERILSPVFIASERYGTRASTVILISGDGRVWVTERAFGAHGVEAETIEHTFELERPKNHPAVGANSAGVAAAGA